MRKHLPKGRAPSHFLRSGGLQADELSPPLSEILPGVFAAGTRPTPVELDTVR